MKVKKITKGQKFGYWTTISPTYSFDSRKSSWWCECGLCGEIGIVRNDHLTAGNSKSCGCSKIKLTKANNTIFKNGAVYIELNDKHGEVSGYAIVDEEDYDKVKNYRWYNGTKGYIYSRIGTKTIIIHMLIVGSKNSYDHKNRLPYDNRKCNLRRATRSQNMSNRGKHKSYCGKKTSSIYKGVSWHKGHGKWYARIGFNNKSIYLGLFYNEEEAALAYNKAAKHYFGEFARINKID